LESSTNKGTELENRVFDLVSKMLNADNFFVPKKTSAIFKKKGYYSVKRGKNIVFDVTIETTLPGADKYSVLTIIECKNLNRSVTVDDIEELGSKINQIGEHNTKGIVITTHSFQESALSIAEKEGIGLVRLNSTNEIQWVNYRKDKNAKNLFENYAELTDKTYQKEPFICKIKEKRILNFADLLIEYSIIDCFNDSEEFIVIPFISDDKIDKIIRKLYNYGLYKNSSLDFEKLLPFLEERYQVKFHIDDVESDNCIGKIEFNPLCIKISKSARNDNNRWRFTVAHEIGHLILHSKFLKDRLLQKNDNDQTLLINFSQSKSNSDRLEIQANLFASNLLLPKDILLHRMNSIFIEYRIHRRQLYLDHQLANQREVFEILNKLSHEFQASVEAVKNRLIKLDLMIDKTDSSIKTFIRRF